MKKKNRRVLYSFSVRLVVVTMLFIIVGVSLVTALVINTYTRTYQQQNEEQTIASFVASQSQIDKLLKNAVNAALFVSQEAETRDYILNDHVLLLEEYELLRSVVASINSTFVRFDYINGILFFSKLGMITGSANVWTFTPDSSKRADAFALEVAERYADMPSRETRWLGAHYVPQLIDVDVSIDNHPSFGEALICGLKPFSYNGSTFPARLFLLVSVKESALRECYEYLSDRDSSVTLLDAQGRQLSISGGTASDGAADGEAPDYYNLIDPDSRYGSMIVRDTKQQLIYYRLQDTNWLLVKRIPLTIYMRQSSQLLWAAICIIGVILLFTCLLYVLWARTFTRPFREIVNKLKEIQSNNLDARMVENGYIHEFNVIGKRFNAMAGSIQTLQHHELEIRQEMMELELRTLQSQINPHFIYNSIASIRWLATLMGANRIAEMLIELAETLKPIFQEWALDWTVANEVDFLRHYMNLMCLRYDVHFEIESHLSQEQTHRMIPRFILQPLLENACEHGALPKGKLNVRLCITEKNNDVTFEVHDNGQGIAKEQFALLRSALKENNQSVIRGHGHNGIGLCNVNRRLQLIYGLKYGLTIESAEGNGTTVLARLRLI